MVKRSQPFCTNTSSMKFGLIKCPQYARHKHQRLNKKEYLTFKQRVVMQSCWQGPMLRHTVRLRVFQQMGQLWPLNCTDTQSTNRDEILNTKRAAAVLGILLCGTKIWHSLHFQFGLDRALSAEEDISKAEMSLRIPRFYSFIY